MLVTIVARQTSDDVDYSMSERLRGCWHLSVSMDLRQKRAEELYTNRLAHVVCLTAVQLVLHKYKDVLYSPRTLYFR